MRICIVMYLKPEPQIHIIIIEILSRSDAPSPNEELFYNSPERKFIA